MRAELLRLKRDTEGRVSVASSETPIAQESGAQVAAARPALASSSAPPLTPSPSSNAATVADVPVAGRKPWKIMVPAAVVIVAAVAGGLYFRSRSTTTLTEKDTIVLADFANHTGDPVFDDTLRQGVSVQLSQSPFLSLLPDRKVSDMLKLMGRAPGDGSSSMASFNSGRAGVSPFWCRIF